MRVQSQDYAAGYIYSPTDAQLQQCAQHWHQASALLATAPHLVLGNPAANTASKCCCDIMIFSSEMLYHNAALTALEPLAPHLVSVGLAVVPFTPGIVTAMATVLCNVTSLALGFQTSMLVRAVPVPLICHGLGHWRTP
jgi:hypothetical protein